MAVELRYSGGAGNKFAVSSIGGSMSSEVIPDNNPQNLFDDVNRVEVINGRTEYRMFYLYNNSVTDYMRVKGFQIIIPANTEIAFAVDDDPNPQLLATEDSVPSGLYFYDVDEWLGLKVPIGLLDQSKGIPIWMRRKVIQGADTVRIIDVTFDGDDNNLTFTQDFFSHMNAIDNVFVKARSAAYFTDLDFIGESLTS